jgi:hypothetical protein
MTKVSWTQALCTACWLVRKPGMTPVRTKFREREQCCDCGMPTTDGIYIREDPWTVKYPRVVEPEDATAQWVEAVANRKTGK